jgi:hypothetical protein
VSNSGNTDYDQRQYQLMIDQITKFNKGDLKFGALVSALKGLLAALQGAETGWKESFINDWGTMETIYAMALNRAEVGLDEKTGSITFTNDEHSLIRESIENLQRLIQFARHQE